jgi:hypothetical protein
MRGFEDLVRELAAIDPELEVEGRRICVLCEQEWAPPPSPEMPWHWHAPLCLWIRAKAVVAVVDSVEHGPRP